MKIRKSGASYSPIVGIGEKIQELAKESGQDFLKLHRGINSVVPIRINSVARALDFETPQILEYPRNSGWPVLRRTIAQSYFESAVDPDDIFITCGGSGALSLTFATLDVEKVWLPRFYWGAYAGILTVEQHRYTTYPSFLYLLNMAASLRGHAVVICDPNNPLGNKTDDNLLLEVIERLTTHGAIVVLDCPYRKIFSGDNDLFFSRISKLTNTIIVESFSKYTGLSGQRIGFVWCNDKEFRNEFNIRLLYATNGVNGFAQVLVNALLSTAEGQTAVQDFRAETCKHINLNINYLRKRGILAEELYADSDPVGIFAVVGFSEEELLKHRISSVGLYHFTSEKEAWQNYTRICVSVPHDRLRAYFDTF